MTDKTNHKTMFASPLDNAADMLNSAASVIRFLSEITESLIGDQGANTPALSERGSYGLYLILAAVEHTIDQAQNKL